MSSNLKVNTILPSTGTTIGIGTVGGLINVVGNIDVNSTSGISTFNGLEISGIVTAKAGAAVTYYGDGSNLTGITSPAITSIGSDGTARVLTSDGDGTATAHSEVKIETVSGNKRLSINRGTGSTEVPLLVRRTDASGIVAEFSNSGGYGVYIGQNGATGEGYIRTATGQPLVFTTNAGSGLANERLRITSDGKMGFGTNSPDQKLHVYESSGSSHCYLHVQNNRSRNAAIKFTTTQGSWLVGQGIGVDADRLMFYDTQQRMGMDSSGNMTLNTGNLVMGTSGKGIDFSSTADAPLSGASMSNELLDDYEEGSFTPSGFCDGGSVTNQSCKYTKIGKCVFIYLYVSSINIPNTACQWKLYGLPFTVSGSHYPALAVGYSGNGNLPAEIRFLCRANTNWIYSHSTAGTAAYLTNQGMRAYIQGQELLVTGYYFTDS